MLDPGKLSSQIKNVLDTNFHPALESAFIQICPSDSVEIPDAKDKAKAFADCIKNNSHQLLADGIASAIDYYIRQISIFGVTLIFGISTAGSPVAQQQILPLFLACTTLPVGMGGGNLPLPNVLTLGIQ